MRQYVDDDILWKRKRACDAMKAKQRKDKDHAESEASGTAYDCVEDRLSLIRERPEGERDKEEEASLERCLKWLNT